MKLEPLGHSQCGPDGVLGDTATNAGYYSASREFSRACARLVFGWRECRKCGTIFRAEVGHTICSPSTSLIPAGEPVPSCGGAGDFPKTVDLPQGNA